MIKIKSGHFEVDRTDGVKVKIAQIDSAPASIGQGLQTFNVVAADLEFDFKGEVLSASDEEIVIRVQEGIE